jgi:hypothetical protein
VSEAFANLSLAVRKSSGIALDVGYHEAEDRYDEIDGAVFTVDNRFVQNPDISKEAHAHIESKYFVTFG